MGAKGKVECETLLAGNSIEETMSEQAANQEDEVEIGRSGSTRDQQRLKSLLQSLRFITDHHWFAKNIDERASKSAMIGATRSSAVTRKRPLTLPPTLERPPEKKVRFRM